MGHHHTVRPLVERYEMSSGVRTTSFILMGIGALLLVLGVFLNMDYPARIWGTMIHNSYFFLGIGMAGMFYIAAQTVGYSGWVVLVSRVCEGMGGSIPVMAVLFGLSLFFGLGSVYEWAKPGVVEHDALIAKKLPFLTRGFFLGATIVYLALWVGLTWIMRKNSYAHDTEPGLARYVKAKKIAMAFLFVWAISSSTAMWHWFMSIDPHWFSTLYGWYTFISIFVSGIAMTILITMYLKSKGYLIYVNDEHIHDLGKWMFAFSVAWTYLWFSQFMLIWYANIPEETNYFMDRFLHYPIPFYVTFVINFLVPFLLLMTAKAKRNYRLLSFVAVSVLFGHWLDFYMLTMPGAIKNAHYMSAGSPEAHALASNAAHGVGEHAERIFNFGFGPLELGTPLFLLGLFLFLTFRSIQKHSLVPVNHPFVRESADHQTHSI